MIGNNVTLSYAVKLITGGLALSHNGAIAGDHRADSISVGDNVWVGANAIVLPGIKIGEGAVIAAGSVVTKNVDPFTVVAGIPAKAVRQLSLTVVDS